MRACWHPSLPPQESGERLFADYSIVVVAAGTGSRTPCGDLVKAFCITAPGAYKYIDKDSSAGSDANAYDDADTLADGAVTANAAASLVAGGIAVLESIFGDQLTSKELVDRMLRTAARNFDLDGTSGNDYVDINGGMTREQQYGVGLMDLECASRPLTTIAKGKELTCRRATTCTGAMPIINSADDGCTTMLCRG